jgi:hypothetical protein
MTEKFKRALILSGGGTRSAIYVGMFAALDELGMAPDVLIASCGGAFAANVINAFPDHLSRKDYLKSQEYFDFVSGTRLTNEKKLSRIGILTLKKFLNKKNAPYIEDIFSKYLVEMNQDLSKDFPSLKTDFSKEIPTVIIGSEILFDPNETGQKRNNRKLYQKLILTDPETAKKIIPAKIILDSDHFKNSAIAETTVIRTDFSMLESTRISVSDMFYVAPFQSEGKYFAGGAIDLIPIELAKYLADKVFIEKKQAYNPVEESFVRAVLGYSGNERLREIESQNPDYQIDTTSIKQELDGYYIKKNINWKNFGIDLALPKTYGQFRENMERQWQYGFDQTMKSLTIIPKDKNW